MPRIITAAFAAFFAGGAAAQGLFAPVATVDDRVVTAYEVDQRARFIQLIGQPGDPDELALDQLIDDRLRLQAAEAAGIEIDADELAGGLAEFAARAELTTEEFTQALGQNGVDPETFRDFVRAGLAFRELVRERFVREVRITEDEVDRAIAGEGRPSGIVVQASRIVYRADNPDFAAQARQRIAALGASASFERFAAEARQFSVGPAAQAGGRIPATALEELPGPLADLLLALQPGEISEPVSLAEGQALAVFQLRALQEVPVADPAPAAIDYAAFYIPGGRTPEALAEAARLRAGVDTCDDLYPIARATGPERLDRGELPPSQIPADIAQELALLDAGEVSTALTRANGRTLVFLMLCDRVPQGAATADRDAVLRALQNRRLEQLAEAYLQTLRSEARIEILR
ncbi:MAG: SurA N-terminal domain-containing protein [Hasllibacter sp.]